MDEDAINQDFNTIFGSALGTTFPYSEKRNSDIAKTRSLLKGELFFDLLMSDVAGLTNSRDIYPPTHVDGLKKLHRAISDAEIGVVRKSSLYYYILKDWSGDAPAHHLSRTLLPETFYVLIDAFYALDTLAFQDSLTHLTNPIITLNYIPKIIRTFLNNSDASLGPKLVVTFIETTQAPLENESTIKLYFKALVQISIESAFRFQRAVSDTTPLRTSLLNCLFEYCLVSEDGSLALKMVNLPLNPLEEDTLRRYLLGSKLEIANDAFLIHKMHLGQLRLDESKMHSSGNQLLNNYLRRTRAHEFPPLALNSTAS